MYTLEETITRAQQLANKSGQAHGVWEHVGDYGRRDGDIEARHTFKVQSFNRPDPPDEWALVACVDPDAPERADTRHTFHGGESEEL